MSRTNLQAIVLWPNSDAGSDDIARGIRKWREKFNTDKMHFFKNLKIEFYIHLLKHTSCLIGNSSSGIREGAYIGTPVVNIGSRQNSRERSNNVKDVGYHENEIFKAINYQLKKKYKSSSIYGSGDAAKKIVKKLLSIKSITIQKKIRY